MTPADGFLSEDNLATGVLILLGWIIVILVPRTLGLFVNDSPEPWWKDWLAGAGVIIAMVACVCAFFVLLMAAGWGVNALVAHHA